jgi:hypothetical protein
LGFYRWEMANPSKSLPELIASGGFRPDRHWHLVVGTEQPKGVPDHTWNEIVSKAKAYARRKIEAEKRQALALAELADKFSPDEEAAYEALLEGLSDDAAERLRDRPVSIKRIDANVQMLNPLDMLRP